jgi:hypothetical protein
VAGGGWPSIAIVALPLAAACLPASLPLPSRPPEAARRPQGEAALAENAACERCHVEVAAEWRASLHRASWTEPSFQRAFQREPLPFCQGCHAPEADPAAAPDAALGELGTGCVTCHRVAEGVLAASRDHLEEGEGEGDGAAPHPIVRDGRLDGDAACARCHEFAFPVGGRPVGREVPMQGTVSEHRASPAAAEPCASCHMPRRGDGGRGHRFGSSRDAARIRAAVQVEARRTSPASVVVALTSNVRGHAFPTGDLFRRLEVLVEAVAPGEVLVASDVRYLGRRFPIERASPGGSAHRSVGADDRLGSERRELSFDLGAAAAGLPIRYRVSYQRVAHPVVGDEGAAELDGEVEIASGHLAP